MIVSPKDATPSFCLRLPTTPLATRMARRTVRAFAARVGFAGERLDEIELAVAESCANAVVHGVPDGEGTFEVTGILCGDAIIVSTLDTGVGVPGARESTGLGLGIPLITALADDVSFGTPAAGGTEVRMAFFVGSQAGRTISPARIRPPVADV